MVDLKKIEEQLTRPSADLIRDVKGIEGDFILLGIGGKMGVSMGRLLVDALKEAGC